MWATILIIFVVIAIIGLGIGLFARSMSKTRWLKQHGTRIIARVTDSIFAAGSGSAKIIIAEWTDPGQIRRTSSAATHHKLCMLNWESRSMFLSTQTIPNATLLLRANRSV